jgi:hypothetical protein
MLKKGNMKSTIVATVLSTTFFLSACTKNHPPAPPPSVEKVNRIAVKLNAGYLPASQVDSAVLFWELNGQVEEKKMQLSNDTLFTNAKELPAGAGRLTVQIFSKIALRYRNLQWEKRTEVNLKHSESINLAAPAGFDDPAWNPRVIMIDEPTKFTAIVALRPADPFFQLKNVPTGYKIELERNYVATPGGAQIVGGGLWKCNTVCTNENGIIENRDFFSPLPAQIGGKPWKMVEIGIGLFGSNHSPGPGFYFNHY